MPWEKVDPSASGPEALTDAQVDQASEHDNPLGQLTSAAIGFGNTATFGGLNAGYNLLDKALGVDTSQRRQDIIEQNPMSHLAGQAAAILTGTGAAGLAKGAAEEAAGALGGGMATKLGVENALLTLGDEYSKAFTNNPDSIQTALIHTGLSGVLGAAAGKGLGAASKLWESKVGDKAEVFMKDFTDAMRSESSEGAIPPAPDSAGYRAGTKFADKARKFAEAASSEGAGAVLGKMSGVPGGEYVGYLLGKTALKPLMSTYMPALINPILKSEASATGLRAAVEAIDSFMKGESLLNKAAKSVFEAGSANIPMASDEDVEHLNNQSSALASHPEGMMAVGGDIGHYLPNHQTSLAMAAQNAVNYLESNRPKPVQLAPLDAPIAPNKAEWGQFNRTLQIAEQPLSVFKHVKEGTLIPKDVQDLQALYPSIHQEMSKSLGAALMEHISSGKSVPYQVRRSISMLLGTPVGSALVPQSILAAQSTFLPLPNSSIRPQAASKGSRGPQTFKKTLELNQTPSEARTRVLQKA